MTTDKALNEFIKDLKNKNRASATIIAYSKDIEQLIEYFTSEGITNANEVKTENIAGYMQKLELTGYTKKSISRKTNSTKTFFKYLYESGIIKTNPADLVVHPKLSPKAPRILSKIEYKALRDAVKNDLRTAAIVEVLLQAGIRISELSNLKTEDVELSQDYNKSIGTMHIPENGNTPDRKIPLNSAIQKAIGEYLAVRPNSKRPFLFVTKTGNQLLVRNIRATLGKYFKDIGLVDVKVNDLRHTFIAHQLQNGTPLYVVSQIAGHKRISTTEKYLEYVQINQKSSSYKLEEL